MATALLIITLGRQLQNSHLSQSYFDEIPQVIEKLNRTPFDPNKFKFENECKICLMEYEADDELTQLKCDERH